MVRGVYATKDGAYKITSFMYLALSLPGAAESPAVADFDAGMTQLEFNMVGCADTKHCDFSSAAVEESRHFFRL